MELDIQTLLAVCAAIGIPVVGYFFKTHERKFEEHDKRMDGMEKHSAETYTTKNEWQRELDRTNRIVGEIFQQKADKELVEKMVNK